MDICKILHKKGKIMDKQLTKIKGVIILKNFNATDDNIDTFLLIKV